MTGIASSGSRHSFGLLPSDIQKEVAAFAGSAAVSKVFYEGAMHSFRETALQPFIAGVTGAISELDQLGYIDQKASLIALREMMVCQQRTLDECRLQKPIYDTVWRLRFEPITPTSVTQWKIGSLICLFKLQLFTLFKDLSVEEFCKVHGLLSEQDDEQDGEEDRMLFNNALAIDTVLRGQEASLEARSDELGLLINEVLNSDREDISLPIAFHVAGKIEDPKVREDLIGKILNKVRGGSGAFLEVALESFVKEVVFKEAMRCDIISSLLRDGYLMEAKKQLAKLEDGALSRHYGAQIHKAFFKRYFRAVEDKRFQEARTYVSMLPAEVGEDRIRFAQKRIRDEELALERRKFPPPYQGSR